MSKRSAFDLHALAMPPAFILSQDQTLKKFFTWFTIQVNYAKLHQSVKRNSIINRVYIKNINSNKLKTTTFGCNFINWRLLAPKFYMYLFINLLNKIDNFVNVLIQIISELKNRPTIYYNRNRLYIFVYCIFFECNCILNDL